MSTPKPFIYLAAPYSHGLKTVRERRYHMINMAAGKLMIAFDGALTFPPVVFSPISHSHTIAADCKLPKEWEWWEAQDMAYLELSHTLVVLRLPGWRQSRGVTAEIKRARQLGIPVDYIDPELLPFWRNTWLELKEGFERVTRAIKGDWW